VDEQGAVGAATEPGIAAAKAGETGFFNFGFEGIEAAKASMDGFGQIANRFSAGVGAQHFPIQVVVVNPAAVVTHGGANGFWHLVQVFEQVC